MRMFMQALLSKISPAPLLLLLLLIAMPWLAQASGME